MPIPANTSCRAHCNGRLAMTARRTNSSPASHDRRENIPSIPGISGFVPVHIIIDALSRVLALALHRDAAGNPRAGLSSHLLAAALRDGTVVCDPLVVRWTPPFAEGDVLLRDAFGTATRHEGEHHRHLRATAVGLLAAWVPDAEIEAEQTRSGLGRFIRSDLQVRTNRNELILAEVGAVEGDAIAALLLSMRQVRKAADAAQVTHVAVLPFSGRRATFARGYTFRLAEKLVLTCPSRAALKRSWDAVRVQIASRRRSD